MTLLRSGRVWVGIAVSLLCIWLAFRMVPFSDLGRPLGGANLVWLVPAAALQLISIVVRARRWTLLLDQKDRVADAFWAQGVGYLFTNVLPLRLGEPARVLVMSQRCRLPVVQVAVTAVVERLLDVATILSILVLLLPWMDVPTFVGQAGLVVSISMLVGLTLLMLASRFDRQAETWLRWLVERARLLPAEVVLARWRELVAELQILNGSRIRVRAIGWSVASWLPAILTYWCFIRAFKADGTLGEAAFLLVALSLAVTVPSSPGFIGVFQLAGQQALVVAFEARYDAATALAISLAAHLTYYLLTNVLGVLGLWRLGESFAGLGRVVLRTTPRQRASRDLA